MWNSRSDGSAGLYILLVWDIFSRNEALIMSWSEKIMRNIGKILITLWICAMLGLVTGMFFSSRIQFAGNGLFWATSVCYVNDMVSKEDQVKGQSLLFIACSGISGFIANYTGGKILEYTSLAALKNTACICGFVGMVCMILSVINRKNRGDSKCRIFNSI